MVNIILLTVSIISLTLGIFVLSRNPRDKSSILYCIFAVLMAMWAFGMSMYAQNPANYDKIILWSKILHFAGLGISMTLFLFAISFTKSKIMSSIVSFLVLTPGLIVAYLTLFSSQIIDSVNFLPGNRQLVYGHDYIWYFILFSVYIVFALVLLLLGYLHESGTYKQQLKYIFYGILIPSCIAFVLNMVLPAMGNFKIAWSGPIFLLIENACIGYAIMKFKALNVKALFSEMMALLLAVIVLTWLISNVNIINVTFFIFVCILCVILVRSITLEAKQKERIEKLAFGLEEANKKLEELDKIKDDFLSMASHELNTPISAIEGYLSMIIDEKMGGELSPTHLKYLTSVYTSSKRLAALVKDLLNVSRIESGRIHIIYSEAQMEEVIDQSVMEVKSKVDEAKHTLTVVKPEKPVPKTWFDIPRITEVIINLIGNSIKYTDEGGKIEVGLKSDEQNITVWVKDNGRGIPKDRQGELFQKFTQADALKDEGKGTGLGLYISKNFVELQKGKIWFESEGEGKGTTFYFSLPILKQKPADEHEGEGAVIQMKSTAGGSEGTPGTNRTENQETQNLKTEEPKVSQTEEHKTGELKKPPPPIETIGNKSNQELTSETTKEQSSLSITHDTETVDNEQKVIDTKEN
ncbi:MAG: ATP-binding protein [Patescibacteria group bacterium]